MGIAEGKRQIADKNFHIYLLKKLGNSCPKFKMILSDHIKGILDKKTSLELYNELYSCGLYDMGRTFLKLSENFKNENLDLIESTSKKMDFITCEGYGCDETDIMACFGKCIIEKDKSTKNLIIINSPMHLLLNYSKIRPPQSNQYKAVRNLMEKSKHFSVDKNGCLYKIDLQNPLKIANFVPIPKEEILICDGNKEESKVVIGGILEKGIILEDKEIQMSEVFNSDFINKAWGMKPYIYPGKYNNNYFKQAIHELSLGMASKRVYSHTGWIKNNDGKYIYLHANGAIGNHDKNLYVKFNKELERYYLPNKVENADIAIKKSLSFLDITKMEITVPMLATAYLSPLIGILDDSIKRPNFITWVYGFTGSRKTSLSLALLNHFGNFSSNTPTASFKDTINSLELKCSLLKDSLILIDDFHPNTSQNEANKMNKIAESLLRNYGDRIGRNRMNQNLELREAYIPKGMCIVTGEDVPNGESSTARYIGIEIKPKDVDLNKLKDIQENYNMLSEAMYLYIKWISDNVEKINYLIKQNIDNIREHYISSEHGRYTEALSWLEISIKILIKFIADNKYCESIDLISLENSSILALESVFASQSELYRTQKIDEMFIQTLIELINTEKVHLRCLESFDELTVDGGVGEFIGYIDKKYLYLYMDTAYNAVNKSLASKGKKYLYQKKLY